MNGKNVMTILNLCYQSIHTSNVFVGKAFESEILTDLSTSNCTCKTNRWLQLRYGPITKSEP